MTTSLTGVCENLAEKCKNEKMELERDLSEKTTKFERNQEADTKCVADLSKLRYVTSPKINSVDLLTSRRRQFGCALDKLEKIDKNLKYFASKIANCLVNS